MATLISFRIVSVNDDEKSLHTLITKFKHFVLAKFSAPCLVSYLNFIDSLMPLYFKYINLEILNYCSLGLIYITII